MAFDLCENICAPKVHKCTEKDFKDIIDSGFVSIHCEAYAATGNEEEKRALPAFCFQAHFTEGKRCNANAQSSGLYMLDVDHIEGDAYEFGKQIVDNWVTTCSCPEIYIVHVTPSGHGLRIVAKAKKDDPDTIAECQAKLAKKLGVECDPAVKDLARASFAVPRKNVLYYNPAIFTDEPEKLLKSGRPTVTHATTAAENIYTSTNTSTNSGTNAVQEAASLTYEGVKVSDIVRRYFEINGKPQVGSRNTTLYKFARSLRYLCDFQPQLLAAALPHFGLPDAEVERLAISACESSRGQEIPQEIADIVASLQQEDEGTAAEEKTGTATKRPALPPLPPVIADFVKAAPDDFKIPALMASLPPLGTQFTALRAEYEDHAMQSPSLMCVIEAPQASGKSFTKRIVETIMRSIKAADEQERLKEQAYHDELKHAKNKAKQPSDPRAVIRKIPVSISVAKLLQRMDYAGGRHLFSFSEELDSMTKSNKSGTWAQKSDIYRNAFDNAEYGQDYISEGTYSATVRMYYNFLVCGTPKAVSRFFYDAEDGLVSRCIFCQLPSQFGKEMPKFKKMDEKTLAALSSEVDDIAKSLGTERLIALPKVKKHLKQWNESQRLRAIEELDKARDTFRRRAAVIGFRAAMVAFALWKCEKKKETAAARFGVFVAEQVLEGQLERFAQQLNEQSERRRTRCPSQKVLKLLPQEFTRDDLTSALKRCGRKSDTKVVVSIWKTHSIIEELVKNKYRKL